MVPHGSGRGTKAPIRVLIGSGAAFVEGPWVAGSEPSPGQGRKSASTSAVAPGVVGLTHNLGYDSPKPASAETFTSSHNQRQVGLDTAPHPKPFDVQEGGGSSLGKGLHTSCLTSCCYRPMGLEYLSSWVTVIAP